jgi:hypothetical protein
MGWPTILATFSQTNPVTLPASERGRGTQNVLFPSSAAEDDADNSRKWGEDNKKIDGEVSRRQRQHCSEMMRKFRTGARKRRTPVTAACVGEAVFTVRMFTTTK